MIQEADLNTNQEFSACAVDSELQKYFDFVVHENIRTWHILQIIGSTKRTLF